MALSPVEIKGLLMFAWTRVGAGVLLLLWGLLFWPIIPGLWNVWMIDSNNSHGVLVPLMVAYLIWQRRNDIAWGQASPSLWGLGLLTGSLLIYLLSLRMHIAFFGRLTMVGTLAGLLWWNLGGRIFRQLLFPMAFLVFMIPVPDSVSGTITFPLQLFAASTSATVIRALGIPVLQEGTMLYFANAMLEVSEACSGIRSAMAYLTLGVLFTHLAGDAMGRVGKSILLLSTLPLALLVNILRISGTGLLASLLGEQIARGFLHEFSGMVVFAFGFLLFWSESLLVKRWLPNGQVGLPVLVATEKG